GTSVARTNHNPLLCCFFWPKINHGERIRGVGIDVVGFNPKKKVTELQIIELKGISVSTQHGIEISRFPQSDELMALGQGGFVNSVFGKNVVDKSRAIYAAVGRIC